MEELKKAMTKLGFNHQSGKSANDVLLFQANSPALHVDYPLKSNIGIAVSRFAARNGLAQHSANIEHLPAKLRGYPQVRISFSRK